MEVLRIGSTGPSVELLQSTLKKLYFYTEEVDGIFQRNTELAVEKFQNQFGLQIDGIVGYNTWNALFPYINGYTNYEIKSGDSIYTIATNFSTDVNLILVANPNLNVNNLRIGERIIVPFGNIVPTDVSYTYDLLQINIKSLKTIFPFLEIGSIGKSVLQKEIPYIRIGNGKREVFYNASFHANEWITSPVLMKFVEDYAKSYVLGEDIMNYNVRKLFEEVSLYIVPMVNLDGVDLVTGGLKSVDKSYKKAQMIASNFPDIPFPSGWKANINGVDLNLQFPAGWEKAKEIKYAQGFNQPAPRDFVGYAPLSEPESFAVYNFTLIHNFSLVIAYHTQGQEIYWRFQNYNPPYSEAIGRSFSEVSGYALAETPYNSSFAGYKDWFIQNYNRPGYTIEAGLGVNPLPISQFNSIYQRNLGILILGLIYG